MVSAGLSPLDPASNKAAQTDPGGHHILPSTTGGRNLRWVDTAPDVSASALTLRFADAELEAAYRNERALEARPRLLATAAMGATLWGVGGLLTSALATTTTVWLVVIPVAMIVANVAGGAFALRARSFVAQQAIGGTVNTLSGIAVVALASSAGVFDRFAAPALILTAVFAFVMLRLAFVVATVASAVYLTAFTAFAVAGGRGPIVLDLLLVASAVVVASAGSRRLEAVDRRLFIQRRELAFLHARVDRLLRQYLSPDVAAALIGDPSRARLGGEVQEVTVLFADLGGFTTFSERTPPDDVVRLLNVYFEAAVPVVLGHGGTVMQFVGDALMAVFNAPVVQPDHAFEAVQAALDFQKAVDAIAFDAPDRPRFRIGLNTGPALVGNVGSDAVRNFAAIGDTTNLAARLQNFAAPGAVVVGLRTYELVADRVVARRLGALDLKGKSRGTDAYEVLGLLSPSTGSPAAQLPSG